LEYQCHFKAIGNIKKEEENIGKSKLLNAIMSSHRCLLKKKGKKKGEAQAKDEHVFSSKIHGCHVHKMICTNYNISIIFHYINAE